MEKVKIDLHIHTNKSDGLGDPGQVLEYGKKIGLDGLVLTDHDNFNGYNEIKDTDLAKELMVFPSVEITTPRCDVLAYNVTEVFEGTVSEIIKKIHSVGGAAVLAHPYGGFWPNPVTNDIEIVKKFDAIEVFNAMTPLEANVEAMELAKKLKKPGTGGSDAHPLKAVGDAFTVFKDVKNGKDVVNAIKNGKCTAAWL